MRLPPFLFPLLAATTLAGSAEAHVALFGPNGGEVYRGQEVVPIQWFDTISHGPLVTYEIEFSEDFGLTWQLVAADLPYTGGVGSYDWTVPDIDTVLASIRVTMHVTPFQYYDDSSDAPFTLEASYMAYGMGTAVNGVEPTLKMRSLPQAGQQITLEVEDAQPGAPSFALFGSQQASQPFAGVILLNNRDLGIALLTADPGGEFQLTFNLPASGHGMTVHAQAIVFSNPNYSATEGVTFTVMP